MKLSPLHAALVLCLGTMSAMASAADERRPAVPVSATGAASADGTVRSSADAPVPRDGAASAPRAGGGTSADSNSRTVGTTIDDATITAKVKAALFTDELTKARNINVDTMRSTVTLRGMVESQAEAERAERIANSTEGVKAVKSELKVAR